MLRNDIYAEKKTNLGDEGRSFLVNTLTLQQNDSFSKCNSGLVKERTWPAFAILQAIQRYTASTLINIY